jgi:hypothetical protein
MSRFRPVGLLAAVLLLLAAALGVAPATADSPLRQATSRTLTVPAGVAVTGLDLHDGQLLKVGSTYYLYGTEYGCGFTWLSAGTPWCGFGVSTAPSLSGPWSTPVRLFYPTSPDPYNPGKTYANTCGATGQGCFSPRMIQRSGWGANDGVFILWFNAPWYYSNGAPHAYIAMGCNGPAGPCGASAGAPYGSTYRPVLHQCNGANGDPGLSASPQNGALAIVCPKAGTSLGQEQLDYWGTNGTGVGTTSIPGLGGNVEATGTFKDQATGTWVMTYSDPGCGYCAGTQAGYATAPSLLGPWTAPANVGFGQPANGRRAWSTNSCGGQVDTVSLIDGVPWQKLDLWTGQANETGAGLHFEPLTYAPATGTPGDGQLWRPALAPLACT